MEGDNSNTQFASLALWIARRHQLKVDPALRLLDQRFRAMQNPDGGWPYVHHGNTTPTMTCAGLIGLAVAFGATNEAVLQNDPDHPRGPKESKSTKSAKSKQPKDPKSKQPRDPNRDPAIRAGLVALVGGTLLFFLATWLHPVPAGFWRWIG